MEGQWRGSGGAVEGQWRGSGVAVEGQWYLLTQWSSSLSDRLKACCSGIAPL